MQCSNQTLPQANTQTALFLHLPPTQDARCARGARNTRDPGLPHGHTTPWYDACVPCESDLAVVPLVSRIGVVLHHHAVRSHAMPCLVAAPAATLYSSNGHYYQLFTSEKPFKDAVQAAAQSVYSGRRGYLATITSVERSFIVNTMGIRNAWIGGSDYASEGTFRWVDGPEAGSAVQLYSGYWSSGEPNNSGNEDCMLINGNGYFNDESCTKSQDYVVEYEGYADGYGAFLRHAFCCLFVVVFPLSSFVFPSFCRGLFLPCFLGRHTVPTLSTQSCSMATTTTTSPAGPPSMLLFRQLQQHPTAA